MGGERDLGPGKVQASNVLQNMECDESFPLGYVGFVLFRVGGFMVLVLFFIFFPAFSWIEIRLLNFFLYKLQWREKSKENTQILFSLQ